MSQKEMKIRGPKDGYDFDAKQKYREKVWNFFEEWADKDSKILFFPSTEGLEIPLALSLGFKQENLIAVDDNPSAISESKWRKEYPNVKFYGGRLSKVIKQIENDKIKLYGANLDFCNNLSHELIEEFNSFVCSDILEEKCLISLTVMNGRESKSTNTIADLLIENMEYGIGKNYSKDNFGFKNKRLSVVACSAISKINKIDRYLQFQEDHSYMSGNIKMSYGFMEIAERRAIQEDLEFEFKLEWVDPLVEKANELKYLLEKYKLLDKLIIGDDVSRYVLINIVMINKLVRCFEAREDVEGGVCEYYGISNLLEVKNSEFHSIVNDTFFSGFKHGLDSFINNYGKCYITLVNDIIEDIGFSDALKKFDITMVSGFEWWLRKNGFDIKQKTTRTIYKDARQKKNADTMI